jgi:heme-degrading monooxygenase HmoA
VYEEDAVETHYTHTTWSVKPDLEEEFVHRWSEWAEWSHREGLDAPALLLRDLDSPGTFISFGAWQSVAAVKNWRTLSGYNERVARLRELVDSFEPRTLEVTARM